MAWGKQHLSCGWLSNLDTSVKEILKFPALSEVERFTRQPQKLTSYFKANRLKVQEVYSQL